MLAGTQKSLLQKNIQYLSLMNCLGHYSSVFSLLGIRTIASLQHLEFPWNLLSRRLVLKDILRSVLHTTEQEVSLHFAIVFCPDYKNKSNSCCLSWTHPSHMTENLHRWKRTNGSILRTYAAYKIREMWKSEITVIVTCFLALCNAASNFSTVNWKGWLSSSVTYRRKKISRNKKRRQWRNTPT